MEGIIFFKNKMSTIVELNEIATSGYKNFDSLEPGKPYKVFGFEIFKSDSFNKTRDCVQVNIDNGYLILPERFDNAAHKMKKMNTENLFIIFQGREAKSNKLNIEFVEQ